MKFLNKFMGIVSLIQFLFLLFAFYENNLNLLFFNLIVYWFVLVYYAVKNKQNSIVLLFFLITFFTFLLGNFFFVRFFGYDATYLFSDKVLLHVYFSLHLSLFAIYCGFSLCKPDIQEISIGLSEGKRNYLKYLLLKIFKITLVFKILAVAIQAYNTIRFGYVGDGERIAGFYFLDKLVQINYLAFVSYLMLFPSKKELRTILKLYLPIYVFSLLGGSRGGMMYFLFFIMSYLLFRDYILKKNNCINEVILTKKIKWLLWLSLPFVLIFLNLFAYIRLGTEVESKGLVHDAAFFFVQQGGSFSVIGYAKEYEYSFPVTNQSYTFGPLIDFFKNGFLGKILGINHELNEYELPLYGNNMGATITWMVAPDYYYAGGGLGTQYIAELYKDFGYTGIFIFSFLLGILIAKVTFFRFKNWMLNVLFALCLVQIYSMPRDFYLTWLANIISVLNILFLLFVNSYVNQKLYMVRSDG